MDLFNNREIALAIWLLIGIVLATSKKSIRAAFHGVWKAFCKWQILISLGLMVAYIALVVYGLHKTGLWDSEQLKNTILWSFSVAALSLFRIPQIAENENFFRNAIRDSFKLVAIFEFVVTFYTFPLWAELLIIPAATFLVAMQVYAEGKEEYVPVEKFLTGLLTLFGGGLVIYAAYKLITDFWSFAQPNTVNDFTLPIVLSLFYLPFLFILQLYVSYENAFCRLDLTIKDAPVRRYAKRAALFKFHLRTGLLRRWLRNVVMRKPANRQEVKSSIAQVKTLALRQKIPVPVPPEEGWSPYRACVFLVDEGLQPSDYHQDPIDDAQWFASSAYLEIGKGVVSNNIAYYVEGDEHIARRLKLVVDFNDQVSIDQTRHRFIEIAKQLFHRALIEDMPADLEACLTAETPTRFMVQGKTIEVAREPWPSNHGYTLRFCVQSSPGGGFKEN